MIPVEKHKRLLKFINLFLLVCTTFMLLVSLSSTNWLEGEGFRQGLWRYCVLKREDLEFCFSTQYDEWLVLSSSFIIIAFVFTIFSTAALTYHIATFYNNIKRRISTTIFFIFLIISISSLLCSLISFPVVFSSHQIHIHHARFSSLSWTLSWSYGLAWASLIFLTTTTTLFSIDPHHPPPILTHPPLLNPHHSSTTHLNDSSASHTRAFTPVQQQHLHTPTRPLTLPFHPPSLPTPSPSLPTQPSLPTKPPSIPTHHPSIPKRPPSLPTHRPSLPSRATTTPTRPPPPLLTYKPSTKAPSTGTSVKDPLVIK